MGRSRLESKVLRVYLGCIGCPSIGERIGKVVPSMTKCSPGSLLSGARVGKHDRHLGNRSIHSLASTTAAIVHQQAPRTTWSVSNTGTWSQQYTSRKRFASTSAGRTWDIARLENSPQHRRETVSCVREPEKRERDIGLALFLARLTSMAALLLWP
jgi:hypothetical protein